MGVKMSLSPKYMKLNPTSEVSTALEESSESGSDPRRSFGSESHDQGQERETRQSRRLSCLVILSVLNILSLTLSAALFSTWYYNTNMRMNAKLRQTMSYTPILDRVELDMQVKLINGTLFPPKEPSVARQYPNPEADALWEEWELTRFVPISSKDFEMMGKDLSTAVKLEDEIWGYGDDAYAAIFDTYHHLHCLNELRQLIFPEVYHRTQKVKEVKEEMWYIHLAHCVDLLMQEIQCGGNLNLITMHWQAENPYPYPDMSVNRQCIDFDQLTEWRLENSLDMDLWREHMNKTDDIKQAEGLEYLPQPDAKYLYDNPLNLTNPNHPNGAFPDDDFNM